MKILIMGAPTSKGLECFGNQSKIFGGGWIENLINNLLSKSELDIYVCFYTNLVRNPQIKLFDGVHYVALPSRVRTLNYCNSKMIEDLKWAYQQCSPDIVHIIGTEREYDLRLFEIAGIDKTIVSITGMVSYCALHYYGGIDQKKFVIPSFGDFLRKGGPIKEKELFEKLSTSEKKLIQSARYVMGRTTWDYACVKHINPSIEYIHCGEILNDVYYRYCWNINNIDKYRIFVSQGSYPLKGLHKLFEALPLIIKKFPETEVYIAGINMLDDTTFIKKIKRTTYAKYLKKLIKKLGIPTNKIHFTGPLDYNGMLEQYLKANVFVLPSIIENSPNSLGEAMCLGMPCISSCVGGVQDMLDDKVDGFLYPSDEPYMLAHYVCAIFSDDKLSIEMGKNAREHAIIKFDVNQVVNTTYNTYKKVYEEIKNGK